MKPSSTSVTIAVLAAFLAGAALMLVPGCGSSVPALTPDGGGGGTNGGGGTGTGGAGGGKVPIGQTQCSDGLDNDNDGKIDYNDPECVGPLDNDESSYAT